MDSVQVSNGLDTMLCFVVSYANVLLFIVQFIVHDSFDTQPLPTPGPAVWIAAAVELSYHVHVHLVAVRPAVAKCILPGVVVERVDVGLASSCGGLDLG